MRPKAYLHSIGAIADPNQRGRLSRENIALIHKAVAEGIQIDNYSVDRPTGSSKNDSTHSEVPKVSRTESGGIVDIGDEVRPEKSWEASARVNGVTHPVGMRTVCNTCNSSLTYCHCRTPYVWIDHETQGLVTFAMRRTPLPVNPWS